MSGWACTERLQLIERIWLRGVDLNHRPLGYEGNSIPNDKQCQPTKANKTLGGGGGGLGLVWLLATSIHGQKTDSVYEGCDPNFHYFLTVCAGSSLAKCESDRDENTKNGEGLQDIDRQDSGHTEKLANLELGLRPAPRPARRTLNDADGFPPRKGW